MVIRTAAFFMCFVVCVHASSISGRVADSSGQGIAGARVFAQMGIAGDLTEQVSGPDGAFHFANLDAGPVGMFAFAQGYAFGGKTVRLALEEQVTDATITLAAPAQVQGTVLSFKGDALSGAEVSGLLLLGKEKVGIPLDKLSLDGFSMPKTGGDGRFTVTHVPQGSAIGLKVRHPSQAQAAVMDIAAGTGDVRVNMNPGVSVEGEVVARGSGVAVADATIIIARSQPPNDTVTVQTNQRGHFRLRLEPGPYQAQVSGVELRSPGWERLTVSGESASQSITLRVAGTSVIRGDVLDAVTSKPVAGAKLRLSAFGSDAAVVETGPNGRYEFLVVEGENIVQVEAPAGYQTPERDAMRVQVAQGQPVDLLTFWLVPHAPLQVQVLDESSKPLPQAMIRIIRPAQYRWYATDANGKADFQVAQMPATGGIVGLVELPDRPYGAIFEIKPGATGPAQVQVLPLGRVTGSVTGADAKPIEGATVATVYEAVKGEEPLVLWQVLSGKDGTFQVDAVAPYVPLVCVGSTSETVSGQSIPFNLKASESRDIGRIVLQDGLSRETMLGKPLPLPGFVPGAPALVVYCAATEAPMIADALAHARETLGAVFPASTVVVEGTAPPALPGVTVLPGTAPGPAKTYLVDSNGVIRWEGSGIPPVSVIAGHLG